MYSVAILLQSTPSMPWGVAVQPTRARAAPSSSQNAHPGRRRFDIPATRIPPTAALRSIGSLLSLHRPTGLRPSRSAGEQPDVMAEARGWRGAAVLLVVAVLSLFGSPAKASTAEEALVKSTVSSHDIVIFSKTYCPYCGMAKAVFKELKKVPYVVELDQREDGQDIQDALDKIVGRRTVPQVFINGKHLGGSDDTVEAYESGILANLLGIDSSDNL